MRFTWLAQQWEWAKLFFAEDKAPTAPSHKNLIGIAMVAVFCIAFLKKVATSTEIPEIPSGWQIVILVTLGIRSAQSFLERKYNTNNNDKDQKN